MRKKFQKSGIKRSSKKTDFNLEIANLMSKCTPTKFVLSGKKLNFFEWTSLSSFMASQKKVSFLYKGLKLNYNRIHAEMLSWVNLTNAKKNLNKKGLK